ncbi:hypothetical protein F4818DRAFT_237266 [Hypoxylon cercidicola]|nr:hypothetical protein F4818DRAFT_237266 [Hypoxylon cercidicola]
MGATLVDAHSIMHLSGCRAGNFATNKAVARHICAEHFGRKPTQACRWAGCNETRFSHEGVGKITLYCTASASDIYMAIWADRSKDNLILDSRLTLSSEIAKFLTAFMAMYVTFAASKLWDITAYTILAFPLASFIIDATGPRNEHLRTYNCFALQDGYTITTLFSSRTHDRQMSPSTASTVAAS